MKMDTCLDSLSLLSLFWKEEEEEEEDEDTRTRQTKTLVATFKEEYTSERETKRL